MADKPGGLASPLSTRVSPHHAEDHDLEAKVHLAVDDPTEVADLLRLGESAAGIEVVALTTQLRAPGEPRYSVQVRTSRVGASAADFAILADIVRRYG